MTFTARLRLLVVVGIVVLVAGILMAVGVLLPGNSVGIDATDLTIQGTTGFGIALVGILVLLAAFAYWYERR